MVYIKTNTTFIPTVGVRENPFRKLEIRREAQKNFSADKFFFWGIIFCLGSIILQFFLILESWRRLPLQLPLFYSHPWGETVLAKPLELWLLPAVTAVFTIINFILAVTIFGENRFLHRILVVASLVVAVAMLYDLFKIITLIT